jgi:hypothetical protein
MQSSFYSINFITHLHLGLPSDLFLLLPPNPVALHFSPMHATCSVYLLVLELIILITFGEE